MERPEGIKPGECWCGCGEGTRIAGKTARSIGWVKGQPIRFVQGHQMRGRRGGRFKHGMTFTPEHDAYLNARRRCTNPKHDKWKDYGGRGIKFLFTSFKQWFAELGPRPSQKHSVDRKDNDGHYQPGNVRWATKEEQMANRRPYKRKAA